MNVHSIHGRRGLHAAGGLLAGLLLAGCDAGAAAGGSEADVKPPAAPAELAEKVERGKYLVTVLVCNDCHTPWKVGPNGPEPDMSRMLSGHPQDLVMGPPPDLGEGGWVWAGAGTNTAFVGPWGISYTANLTPDEFTGIGIWTEDIFMNTIRRGRHWGVSRPILPPMPWHFYSKLTDEDLSAIFAFLRTIPPIRNQVPDPQPAGE